MTSNLYVGWALLPVHELGQKCATYIFICRRPGQPSATQVLCHSGLHSWRYREDRFKAEFDVAIEDAQAKRQFFLYLLACPLGF